ncbi:MAG: HDOD domain-containing protein, partial [Syntrophaceae bacterium]|nr:HDOD domain-containing protein [Syntrophaceae bacterium]
KKAGVSRPSHPRKNVSQKPQVAEETASWQLQSEKEMQSSNAVGFYPVIPEINYFHMDEEVYPKQLDDVDEKIKKSINQKITVLKPLPVASLKLFDLLKNPQTSASEVATVIKTNPFLSARILRVVNSAYYNLPVEVTAVGRAIILLGYNNVRSLVFQDALQSTLSREEHARQSGFDELWIHSTVVSACAHYLSLNVFRSPENEVATVGVLHDIGKYFFHLLDGAGEKVEAVHNVIQEDEQYGVNHPLTGSILAEKWQLSDVIAKCIQFHHHPMFFPPESVPAPYQQLTFIVCLSDLICKVLGYGGQSDDILPIRKEYFELFGLSSEIRKIVTQPLIQEIEKSRAAVESFINTPSS